MPTDEQRQARVLWLIKGFGLGGAEMLLPMALPYLDRAAFAYRAGYFLPWKDALVPRVEAGGIAVTCFDIRRHGDPRAVTRLTRYIRDHGIDLVHAHLPFTGVVARLAGRLTGVKVVYTEHNLWGRLNPAMRLLNRWSFGWNDFAIAVSRDVADSMRGVDRSRLAVIDNGVDCAQLCATPDDSAAVRAEFGVAADAFLIGKVANLSPKKNHENLIEAFARFHGDCPRSRLVLVGQPCGRDGLLRDLATRLGVAGQVLFAGARTDVPRLVRALDVFVIASDFEGLPVALLEAMALRRAVAVTAVGGIPGVVRDGVEGLLVPPRRPDLLAAAFSRLHRDAGLRQRLGDCAHARVLARYDVASMVAQVESIYRRVLSGQGASW